MALPPPRTTELHYDGAWHPVSVRESTAVEITRGLAGKGTRAEPAAASMTLGNRGGEVSAHDPESALFGKIGRNTPLRFSVDAGGPHLNFPASGVPLVSTPDHASLGVAGDLDVRIDVAPVSWSATAALVSRHRFTGSQVHYVFLVGQDRMLQLLWSPTGSTGVQRYVTATAPVPAYDGQRIVLRATLDINNGSGGCTARFWYARRLDSALWLPIGDPVTQAGTTSIFDGTAPLDIGDSDLSVTPDGLTGLNRVQGRVHAVQVYDGTVLKVDVRPEAQASPGASSFTDGAGRVWTLTGSATLSNRHVRLEGEVPAWPPERHLSGNDSTVTIAPAGIMRRLGIGKRPLDSALRRYLTAAGPVECWPLTDGAEATSGAPLIGTSPVRVISTNPPSWAGGELAAWVEPVLNVDTLAKVVAPAPSSPLMATDWSVDWSFSELDSVLLASVWERSASGRTWNLTLDPALGTVRLDTAILGGGGGFLGSVTAAVYNDLPHHIRLRTSSGGGSAAWWLYIDGVQVLNGVEATDAGPPMSLEWVCGLTGSFNSMALGYVTLWGASAPAVADVYRALVGNPGETAGARMSRVAAEQGVPLSLDGEAPSTTPLGVQHRETFLDTLEVGSKADMGMLLERRDARALLYRARHTLYSQAPILTLDYSNGIISGQFRPVDDDRLPRNMVTARREGGSEHTAVETSGRLSVQNPPLGIGEYAESDTYSLAADEQTAGQAWWRLHVGLHGGLRYPRVTVDLAQPRVRTLLNSVLEANVGDLLRIVNLPPAYGHGHVDLLIRGYTEEISDKKWQLTFTCDPGGPWRVGIYDDPVRGKCDAASSQLTSGITATATSFSVTTTAGLPWITTPGEFPIDITIGGEEMRATAITGASSPQTFTVVRSTNGVVKTHAAATPVNVARPAVYAL
ncbi:hypothetical protein ACGFYE_18710 [Streptomyces zaomyceticus]|uniref:hypothetical protein n=1 Tax=Streptomyces zaomyceticus TaxID=68286 RepID=UPI003724BFFA